MSSEYKNTFSLEERIERFEDLKKKYPGKLFICCERSSTSSMPLLKEKINNDLIVRYKYVIPEDLKVEEFITKLHEYKTEKHSSIQPIYLFCNNVLLPRKTVIIDLYNKYKDEDGMLYLKYSDNYSWGKTLSTLNKKFFGIFGY